MALVKINSCKRFIISLTQHIIGVITKPITTMREIPENIDKCQSNAQARKGNM